LRRAFAMYKAANKMTKKEKTNEQNKNILLRTHTIPFLNDIWVNYTFAGHLPNFCWGIYGD